MDEQSKDENLDDNRQILKSPISDGLNITNQAKEELDELMDYPTHILEKKSGLLNLE